MPAVADIASKNLTKTDVFSVKDIHRDLSTSEDNLSEMDFGGRQCDCKKWIAFAQIALGILLVILEIANVAALNPFFRMFCPGIWIGVIFIATGCISLTFFGLEHIQNKHLSIVGAPPAINRNQIFRIAHIIFSGLSLALCLAMIILLAIVINSLRQEGRSAAESQFSMLIVMLALYILVFMITIFGVVHLASHKLITAPVLSRREMAMQTSLVEERIVSLNPA